MGAGISKKAAMEAVDANTRRLTLLDMVAEHGGCIRLYQKTVQGVGNAPGQYEV